MRLSNIARWLHVRPRRNWQWFFQYVVGLVLLITTGIVCTSYINGTQWLTDYFERKSHDLFHVFEQFDNDHSEYPIDDFIIIYLDDKSHEILNQPWDRPWDRRLHAELLNRIRQDQPRLIFYDMIFDMPSSDPEADKLFAEELAASGNVILGASKQRYFFKDNGQPSDEVIAPHPPFRKAAAGWGIVKKSHSHSDNGLREMHLNDPDSRLRQAYWAAAELVAPETVAAAGSIEMQRWIRHFGPSSTIQTVSFCDVLLNDTTDFKDKYVFIGGRHSVGMPGAGRDVYRSPYLTDPEGEFTGVYMQATMVRNLLTEAWMHAPRQHNHWIMIALSAVLLTLLVTPFGPRLALFGAILFALGFSFASILWIENQGVFVAWLVPVVVQAPVAFVFSGICNYYFLERRRHRLKRIFSTYLSPVMVEQIADAEVEPELGGEEANITPFFSDVVGYSKFSELLNPMELTQLMNEYLAAMTYVIQAEGGTLDKYIGDAIVAIYGAPLHTPDHAYRACRTAVRMQIEQQKLCEQWAIEKADCPELIQKMQTRIGLNTGDAVVGNMGSPVRFNYSMTGDAVNLAARCESGAKHFGVFTMVTQDTYAAAIEQPDHGLTFRRLNRCTVVGREEPVDLYELVGFSADLDAKTIECCEIYEAALAAFSIQDWAGALEQLEQSALLEPHQPGRDWGVKTNPSLLLQELCHEFKRTPPTSDWNGVYNLTSK